MKATDYKQGVEELQTCLSGLINEVGAGLSSYINSLTYEGAQDAEHEDARKCTNILNELILIKIKIDDLQETLED